MATNASSLLSLLESAARNHKACPRLHELGALFGVSMVTVKNWLDELKGAHKITWATPYCGTGVGKVRVVTITSTGQTTTRPAMQKRQPGSGKEVKADSEDLERAKTALRKRGRYVWNAEVSDGAAGKGFVKVDGKLFRTDELIAFAQQTGAI